MSNIKLSNCQHQIDAYDAEFSGSKFEFVNLSSSNLENVTLKKCKFLNVDFDDAAFLNAIFQNVVISGGKYEGMTIDGFSVVEMLAHAKDRQQIGEIDHDERRDL